MTCRLNRRGASRWPAVVGRRPRRLTGQPGLRLAGGIGGAYRSDAGAGAGVEALPLGTLERLERALALYRIIAWRILHLVTWGRDCPQLPCEVVFDPEEW